MFRSFLNLSSEKSARVSESRAREGSPPERGSLCPRGPVRNGADSPLAPMGSSAVVDICTEQQETLGRDENAIRCRKSIPRL